MMVLTNILITLLTIRVPAEKTPHNILSENKKRKDHLDGSNNSESKFSSHRRFNNPHHYAGTSDESAVILNRFSNINSRNTDEKRYMHFCFEIM